MSTVSPLPDDSLLELADRVARLCVGLGRNDQLTTILEDADAGDLLDRTVGLAASKDYDPALMAALLDEIDRTLNDQSVHGLTRPNREWHPLPGVPSREHASEVQVCPLRRCSRTEVNGDGTARCAVSGGRLESVPLPE